MAGNTLFATGQGFNHLERSSVTLAGAASEDQVHPLTRLGDGRVSDPFRFSSLQATQQIEIDTNVVPNGDFELWSGGNPVDWESNNSGGTGDVLQNTTDFLSGASAAQLEGGSAGVSMTTTAQVRAGEQVLLGAYLRIGVAGTVFCKVTNLSTNRVLRSDGVWDTTGSALSETSTTYELNTITFTVESAYKCNSDVVTLSIQFSVGAGVQALVEDVLLIPGIDVMSAHGVIVEDRCKVTWEVSDGGAYSDAEIVGDHVTGFDVDQKPNFYMKRSALIFKQYHRLELDSNVALPTEFREIGELYLVQSSVLLTQPLAGLKVRVTEGGTTFTAGDGDIQVYRQQRWPRHALEMSFKLGGLTTLRQNRDDFWGRAQDRRWPVLFILDDSSNFVMVGKFEGGDSSWSATRIADVFYMELTLTLMELPFVSANARTAEESQQTES